RDEAPVVRRRGDRGLDALLPELLRSPLDACIGERRDVRPGGTVSYPLDDGAPQRGRKAGGGPGVTRRPVRHDAHEQRGTVAVVAQLFQRERVSRRLPLLPEPLPRTAPE